MTQFELGPGMMCDLSVLIERRMLIQASSGGGKSRTLRRILEQTHGKIQQIVIDPEGELVSLREKFDYVLVAATGGDTQAHPRSAGLLAEKLVQLGVSAIIDLYELKKEPQVEFVKNFCTALMEIPKTYWKPRLIAMDECQIFAPEDRKCASTEAVIDLATRGRKRGHCPIIATQRISLLDKNVAAVLHNKLIGFTSLDTDLKRAALELGFDKERMLQLKELPVMRFWGFGPALTRVPTLVDVGPHLTTHPKLGAKLAVPPPPTDRIKALLPQLADLPAEAEHRAKSLQDLQRQVAESNREIAQLRKNAVSAIRPSMPAQSASFTPEPVIERVPVLDPAHLERLAYLETSLTRAIGDMGGYTEGLRSIVKDVSVAMQTAARARLTQVPASRPARAVLPPQMRSQNPTPPPEKPRDSGNGSLKKAAGKVLGVLAQFPDGCEAGKLTLLSGYRYTGSFRNALSELRTAGLMVGDNDGTMRITDAGMQVADYEPLPQGDALVAYWRDHPSFGKTARLIFKRLDDTGGGMTGPDLAAQLGFEYSGSFRNALSELRTAGVIVGKNGEPMTLHPDLFASV